MRTLTAEGRYGDGGGLWLQVRDAQHRSWLFRFKREGRGHWMGLGPAQDITLAEARDKARECRRLLLAGKDPILERRTTRAAAAGIVFREVAAQYVAAHETTWRNATHRKQWASTLAAYVFPVLGDLPAAQIETADVLRVVEPIWQAKPETAARVRGRIEAVLDYATARGWRAGDNPARWRGHLAHLLPARAEVAAVKHHAALPWAEIAAFMGLLRGQAGTGALALQFSILTAARTGEVIGATWAEIDLDSKSWTIPAERMKARVEHRVPLSTAAAAILAKLRPLGGVHVFPGTNPKAGLSNMALSAVLRRMGRADLTVHGFRSTFRDWAAEASAYPRELADAALAHTIKDKVLAAYQRGDLFAKRAALMADWADYCGGGG